MYRRKSKVWARTIIPMLLLLGFLLAGSGVAFADSVVSFSGSGVSGIDGRPQNAMATFSFVDMGGGTFALTVTLENTAGPGQLGGVSSVLYGLEFSLSGGGTLGLTGATAAGAVDCSSGTCMSVAVPTITWTYGADGLLAPLPHQGIANNNIVTTDGIPNAQHNPYLIGPVTFTFLLTGGPTNGDPVVSEVLFRFGTGDGEAVPPSQTPEPASSMLVFLGLAGLGGFARLRRKF